MKASMLLLGLVGALSACSNGSSTTSSGSGGTGGHTTTATTNATTTTTSGSPTSSSSTQSSTNSTTAMSSSSTGVPTVTISGTIVDESNQAPIAGAKVCSYLHPEFACAMSDAAGNFTEPLVENADTGVIIDKTGYGGVMLPVTTQTASFSGVTIEMATTTALTTYFTQASATYPSAGKGYLKVSFRSVGATQTGSTMTLVPAAGKGPFYAGPSGTYAAGATATSSSGFARFGEIPTTTSMEVDGQCGNGFTIQDFGWFKASMNKLGAPIVDGYETLVGYACSNNG